MPLRSPWRDDLETRTLYELVMAGEEIPSPFDLREHCIDLKDGGAARTLKVGPEFRPNLIAGKNESVLA